MPDLVEQLNNLADVQLPTLALLAVIGFTAVLTIIGLMFRSVANGQASREASLTKVFTGALDTLTKQVELNREAYLAAREEFRGLRDTASASGDNIVKEIINGHDEVKAHSTEQADRAIGVVEKRIETAEENFQTGINLLKQQLQNVNALLGVLDDKVMAATATQSETKSTIETVRSMVNDALTLLKARQDAEVEAWLPDVSGATPPANSSSDEAIV